MKANLKQGSRWLGVVFCLCGWLVFAQAPQKKSPAFPRVSQLKGEVYNEAKAGQPIKLKLRDVLTEHAHFKVAAGGRLRLELDAGSALTLFADSEVELPVITWGEADIPEIKLIRGKIFYSCEKNCRRALSTPLSHGVLLNGESYLEYVPESPRVELTVLHGTQNFSGLENEESIQVHGGERAVFQGLKEDGNVAYDDLLKGRRVARGKMQPLFKISDSEFKALEKVFQVEKEAARPKVIKIKRSEKQICDKPLGELNQCVYLACQRRRCNANGQWADPQVLPPPCDKKPRVAPCDY